MYLPQQLFLIKNSYHNQQKPVSCNTQAEMLLIILVINNVKFY